MDQLDPTVPITPEAFADYVQGLTPAQIVARLHELMRQAAERG